MTEEPNTNPEPEPTEGDDDGAQAEKTYTQAELQSQIDAVVAKRVAQDKAKADEAVKTAVAEAERQAKLTQDELEKELASKRDAEIKAREESITLREQTIAAKEQLTEKGISTQLVDFVVDLDSEKTTANVELLASVFAAAVESGVKAKLSGNPPDDPVSSAKPATNEIRTSF